MTYIYIASIVFFASLVSVYAQELYFDPTFDFQGDDRFEKGKRYLIGDVVTITGHSELYDEKTDEHIPVPGSVFQVKIKDPTGKIIIDDEYVSNENGDVEFSFTLSGDFKIGEYQVEMNVDKRKSLDGVFFVGHKKEMIVKTNSTFDLYTKEAQPVLQSFADLTGKLCGSPMSASSNDQTAFLLPHIGSLLQRNSVQVLAEFTDPNGDKITSTSHYGKDTCTEFTIGPAVNVSGIWSVNVTAWWIEGNTMYEASSDKFQFTVIEPLFASPNIETISVDLPFAEGVRLIDWSPDGRTILFVYSRLTHDSLSLMDPDGTNIRDLGVTSDKQGHNAIDAAKFSPDGKFIHYSTEGGFYRYDLETLETIQVSSGGIEHFDYLQFDFDPTRYTIIVSKFAEANNGEDDDSFVLVDIGSGDEKIDVKNGELVVPDFNGYWFDLSSDGKKILYTKTLESGYGWANRALAYLDTTGTEFLIPEIDVKCGSPPKWAPSGELIVYEIDSCGRGAPGSKLHITTIDGSYSEVLVPYTNTNVDFFVISPDGQYIMYPGVSGTLNKMKLTQSIPEFEDIGVIILTISILPIILIHRFKIDRK